MLFGGLEAGGTKMICAIGDENGNIIETKRFDTLAPEITMPLIIDYFKGFDIKALGILSFGPIDLNKAHKTYGHILNTPKPKWSNYDVYGAFKKEFDIPIGLDSDVNGACLAESIYGAGKSLDNVCYFTVGTGIGVGLYLNGKLHHGLLCPEFGHMGVIKHPSDKYEGCCRFHNSCLEGFASGVANEQRFKCKAENLKDTSELIEIESFYLAQGVCSAIYAYSPEIVILGGGVMHIEGLIEEVRKKVVKMLNNYINADEIINHIDNYIVLPGLKDNAGALGGLKLASIEYYAK